jgi:SAM-dependent methyltransferase
LPIERASRQAGETKYSTTKLLKLASDGIFSFSIVPLRFAALVGLGAIFFLLCEHLRDPVTALQDVRRLLAPGGVFLPTVPAFQMLWTHHDAINHHFRRYSVMELRPLLRNASMQLLEERYAFQWLAPLKLAVRGLECLAGGELEHAQSSAGLNQ